MEKRLMEKTPQLFVKVSLSRKRSGSCWGADISYPVGRAPVSNYLRKFSLTN